MKFKLPALAWFGILYTIVLILALVAPPNPATMNVLHVSLPIYRVIIFTIFIPYGLVWLTAFYAYDALEAYSNKITRSVEGRGYDRIVAGVKMLAWGSILSTIFMFVLAFVADWQPSFVPAHTVLDRYAVLGVTLAAFMLIQSGTFILVESAKARRSKLSIRLLAITTSVVGAFFVKLVSDNQSGDGNPYYLTFYPLLITVVIPYIFAWTIGLIGTHELRLYARRVRGVLYQRALKLVAGGLTLVIVLSIASQYITAAFARQSTFALGNALIIIYTFLLVEAAGFALVAYGAKQLKKIEDV